MKGKKKNQVVVLISLRSKCTQSATRGAQIFGKYSIFDQYNRFDDAKQTVRSFDFACFWFFAVRTYQLKQFQFQRL